MKTNTKHISKVSNKIISNKIIISRVTEPGTISLILSSYAAGKGVRYINVEIYTRATRTWGCKNQSRGGGLLCDSGKCLKSRDTDRDFSLNFAPLKAQLIVLISTTSRIH